MKNTETQLAKVSVVLCFFNEERFLIEAVNSVLWQTFQDWELMLVDDGSSDGSTALARDLSARYPDRIKYIDHPDHENRGLSASRNLGIRSASGEMVAFIDADDVWVVDKLEKQLATFQEHPEANVILSASIYWHRWKQSDQLDEVIKVGVPEGKYHSPDLLFLLYPFGPGAAPCPSGIMVRKSVVVKHQFEEAFTGLYQMYEDQAFLCKVYLQETVFVTNEANNLYRQREASLVSRVYHAGKYKLVRQFFLDWFFVHISHEYPAKADVIDLVTKTRRRHAYPLYYKWSERFNNKISNLLSRFRLSKIKQSIS